MARTDNLTNFLTDVADAIRTKEGTSGTIQASDFDTRIQNLPSGATVTNLSSVKFTRSSGTTLTYNISSSYSEYASITIDNITCMPYGLYITSSSGDITFTWSYNSTTGVITLTSSSSIFSANMKNKTWKIVIIK